MAKRKSKGTAITQAPSVPERKSVETEQAENGFIVRVTHEGKDGYKSKRYVASSLPEANRIAAAGMSGLGVGKKSGSRKARKVKTFVSKKS